MRVGMVSLGCPKNQTDAELMLAKLQHAGMEIVADAALAEVVIINTCGFIESAKAEAIEQILEFAKLKEEGRIKKIIVTGCLAERYKEEIAAELPECDAVIGLGANGEIADVVRAVSAGERVLRFPDKAQWCLDGDRVLTTPFFFSYLRVADGCNNRCAYCAIPLIRGNMKSRAFDKLVAEAETLAAAGVKELVLVAQDTTLYGKDLYGQSRLPDLLEMLCAIDGIRWIRLLYCYPEHITDRLLDVIASQDKIVKYMDIPVQHASGKILRAMHRPGDRKTLSETFRRIREKVPGIVLRTTVMTGFPGETDEDFAELCEFLQEVRFERLGCFAFSPEEGTPAASMPDQVDDEVKEHRRDLVMDEAGRVMADFAASRVGQTVEVLVESFDRYAECWFGRSFADAPDIDTKVFFTCQSGTVKPGDFVRVTITDVMDLDLIGECEA